MKRVIFVPGMASRGEYYNPALPSNSNANWFPWVTQQLMVKDVMAYTLEIPHCYYPEYGLWLKELERYEIDSGTTLVGHSCGGGFLLRWMSENRDVKIDKLILVSPWMGIDFGQDFDPKFFDFELDSGLTSRVEKIVMISSTDDFKEIKQSETLILDKISNIKRLELHDRGHFTVEDQSRPEFPELVEEIMR